jgi:hypothetical protein
MDLLDRYLAAIKPLLPRKTAADILSEISDEIASQYEEKSASLGRPLSEVEQAEVIRKLGHPVIAAARYGTRRYLIGPEVFPYYWLILKVSLISALLIRTIVALGTLPWIGDPMHALVPALVSVPAVLIPVFAWVTAAFAAFELAGSLFGFRLRSAWDPGSLPVPSEAQTVRRTHAAAEVIFGIAGLAWWQLVPATPFLVLGPAATFLRLGPVWNALHWPVLLLIVVGIAKAGFDFVQPRRTMLRARLSLALRAGEIAALAFALMSGNWVETANQLHAPDSAAAVAHAINVILTALCGIGLGVRVIQFIWSFQAALRERKLDARPEMGSQANTHTR